MAKPKVGMIGIKKIRKNLFKFRHGAEQSILDAMSCAEPNKERAMLESAQVALQTLGTCLGDLGHRIKNTKAK